METSANIQSSGRQGGGAGTPLRAPGAGQVQVAEAAAGALFELAFAAEDASPARSGNDLVFNFENGGDQLAGFFAAGDTDALPQFTLPEGGTISGYEFLAALDPDLLPAAEAGAGGAAGGGVGEYSDDAGSLISGAVRLDPLTTSTFGVTALGALTDDPTTPDIDYGVGVTGSAVTVAERGLQSEIGTQEASAATQTGTFNGSAPDGVATVSVGGVTVISGGALVADEGARTVATDHGTLVVTGYDAATGVVSYAYTLTSNVLAAGDAYTFDVAVTATDTDGDAATGRHRHHHHGRRTHCRRRCGQRHRGRRERQRHGERHRLPAGQRHPGRGRGHGDQRGRRQRRRHGQYGHRGQYGTLTIAADGSYTYTLNNTSPTVQHLTTGETLSETFSYTLTDGDGDTATAALTVTISGSDDGVTLCGIGNEGGDLTVSESAPADGSAPDANALAQSGTFTVSAADGLDTISVENVTVISGGVLAADEADRTITTATGTLVITGYDATTGHDQLHLHPRRQRAGRWRRGSGGLLRHRHRP